VRLLQSLLAAACLAFLGVAGVSRPSTSATARLGSSATRETGSLVLSLILEDRETTLLRRRDAETLMNKFVNGQMTRHYWGHFAGSLDELGLDAGTELQAVVEREQGFSRLWLTPRRGAEGWMAEVRLKNDRLERMQCLGSLPRPSGLSPPGCP
jgi:hypothetical protein